MQDKNPATGVRPLGHVTSSYRSSVLGRSIALAMVSGGRTRLGGSVWVPTSRGDVEAQVAPFVFYDPKSERLNV